MLPLRDENPTRVAPVVTVLLIGACIVIYLFVQPKSGVQDDLEFSFRNAAIPCEVVEGRPLTTPEIRDTLLAGDDRACDGQGRGPRPFPDKQVYLAVLFSMFLHANLLHIGSNMLFLWVFGNNIEDRLGKVGFVVFYVLSGLAATAAHIAVQPDSTVPVVGASGAIAGVMGAYLVLFPNVRIHTLIMLGFILFREISAKWLLGVWFVFQFFTAPESGVAWVAHVGGFVFGMAAGVLMRMRGEREPFTTWRY